MFGLDKSRVENLLLQMEEVGYLNPRYKFYRPNNKFVLLGTGTFSYVYEMYDTQAIESHYAAKVIGLGKKEIDNKLILETTQTQYYLGAQSENILRVFELWEIKVKLDVAGNICNVIGINEQGYEKEEGIIVQIILSERLENNLFKDKYGNVLLQRDDLRTEEGIIKFAKDVGKALCIVHNKGFIHRDVKLENIFWDEKTAHYKLGDFGIARYIGDEDAETIVFTNGYGAPEIERQLVNSYNITADMYSFGITLFLLLNDIKFPASDGYYPNFVQYSKDFIIPAPRYASENMSRVIRKMCSYYVENRYQSVEEMLTDLARFEGGYKNEEFIENEDLSTEFYHDMRVGTEPRTDNGNLDEQNKLEEISWWEKEEDNLNRQERKNLEQCYEEMYKKSCMWIICISTILFAFFFIALSPNPGYVKLWQFWVLPITMFIESILQRFNEFQVEFGIITIGLALFSIYTIGLNITQIVIIAIIILGLPAITAGCAMGIGIWIVQILTEKNDYFSILNRWDMGWIVIIGIIIVLKKHIIVRVLYNEKSQKRYIKLIWILDKIWFLLIFAGIGILILGRLDFIVIPEILKHIHLVRVGIGMFLVAVLYLKYYGLLNCEEEENTDESMD